MKDLTSSSSSSTAIVTTGFRTLRVAGSEFYVEYNVVDGVSEITRADHTDGPWGVTMDRLEAALAERLANEA
jgi:hypothetical protein